MIKEDTRDSRPQSLSDRVREGVRARLLARGADLRTVDRLTDEIMRKGSHIKLDVDYILGE